MLDMASCASNRPMLGAPSNRSPAYGATVTIPLTYAGGAAVPITRVVVNRLGGTTHSTHFDQRQVGATLPTAKAVVKTLLSAEHATRMSFLSCYQRRLLSAILISHFALGTRPKPQGAQLACAAEGKSSAYY